MDYEKVMVKLEEYKKKLEKLQEVHHSKGRDDFRLIHDKIKMMIRRIYPNPDEIIKQFFKYFRVGHDNDQWHQEEYIGEIKDNLRVIDMIKEEFEIMGLDNFKPIKEKTETEVKVGIKDVFWRKKKNK